MARRAALDLLGQDVASPVGRSAGKDLGEPQVHGQGHEMLLSAVVDVALQPAALGVLGFDHASA